LDGDLYSHAGATFKHLQLTQDFFTAMSFLLLNQSIEGKTKH